MRPAYDFSPLFRPSIGSGGGFEPLENAVRAQTIDRWPPYHIEKTGDDRGCITLAVDGFSPDELEVLREPNRNLFVVRGDKSGGETGQYPHCGIAGRSFLRRFELADDVTVPAPSSEAAMARITTIDCERAVPDRFEFVMVATVRARALNLGETPRVSPDRDKPTQEGTEGENPCSTASPGTTARSRRTWRRNSAGIRTSTRPTSRWR